MGLSTQYLQYLRLQMKGDAGKKADDVKVKRTDLAQAQKDLEPLKRQLEELRKASRGQVGVPPASLTWLSRLALCGNRVLVHGMTLKTDAGVMASVCPNMSAMVSLGVAQTGREWCLMVVPRDYGQHFWGAGRAGGGAQPQGEDRQQRGGHRAGPQGGAVGCGQGRRRGC